MILCFCLVLSPLFFPAHLSLSALVASSLAQLSASSFPWTPQWSGIHAILMLAPQSMMPCLATLMPLRANAYQTISCSQVDEVLELSRFYLFWVQTGI